MIPRSVLIAIVWRQRNQHIVLSCLIAAYLLILKVLIRVRPARFESLIRRFIAGRYLLFRAVEEVIV